jgi:hypothetical protein
MPGGATLRWYAASRYSYALALRALASYAREHGEDFAVYPASVAGMERAGLSVSGPDLAGVSAALREISGLIPE